MLFSSDDCSNKYCAQNHYIDAEAVLTSSENEDNQSNISRLSDDYASKDYNSEDPYGGSITESCKSSQCSRSYSCSSHSTYSLNLK